MSHAPQTCPFCDGRGATCPHQPNGQPGNRMVRCPYCRGKGELRNATIPGIEPAPPPPAPQAQKKIANGQTTLF